MKKYPCIRSLAKFPARQAKAGQARLSRFLARLTGKMRPGKARQAWPQPSFLGILGHQSLAFMALFVLRLGFLGNLGQKKAWPSWPSRFKPGLARLLWNSRPKRLITTVQQHLASLVILSHEGHSLLYTNANFLQKRSPRFKPALARLFQISRSKKVCV